MSNSEQAGIMARDRRTLEDLQGEVFSATMAIITTVEKIEDALKDEKYQEVRFALRNLKDRAEFLKGYGGRT